MQHEVIVVGGGIGGLTTAALLAARGVDVCLFERQSNVGGCVANFEHLGYSFDPTAGLYSGWENGGTWERVFAHLPVNPPNAPKLSPNYLVRLPDGRDVAITDNCDILEDNIAAAFPQCADAAIHLFRRVREMQKTSSEPATESTEHLLRNTSPDFRLFIDAQLQTFAQCTSNNCSAVRAAAILRVATGGLWSIAGGGQALADCLAQSLRRSGGALHLNSPVLRLAYGTDGSPIGVDLLSGERVMATRAIVSNLTIWDTYGKLVGIGRIPQTISAQLRQMSAWGAYLIFISMDGQAAAALPSRMLLVYHSGSGEYDPANQQLMLNLAATNALRAPIGKRSLTASTFTHAGDWFSFHEDSTAHEEHDQTELEKWWGRLHSAMPELGDRIEVIETATPQTFYEATRRRLGMIGSPVMANNLSHERISATPFPNLLIVSDTVADGLGIEGVAQLGSTLADRITARTC